MKMFFFMIVLAAVVFVVVRNMRKSQAEADLARRRTLERRKKQQQEVLTTKKPVTWPIIGVAAASQRTENQDSETSLPGDGVMAEEPQMTTIEYVPSEQA